MSELVTTGTWRVDAAKQDDFSVRGRGSRRGRPPCPARRRCGSGATRATRRAS